MDIVLIGVLASLVAGLMTGIGALPVLIGRPISLRMKNTLLGSAAGVMLTAPFFSLITRHSKRPKGCTAAGPSRQ